MNNAIIIHLLEFFSRERHLLEYVIIYIYIYIYIYIELLILEFIIFVKSFITKLTHLVVSNKDVSSSNPIIPL